MATNDNTLEQRFALMEDAVFGSWDSDEKKPTRLPGLLERVGSVEKILKRIGVYFGVLLGILVLHAFGVPTDQAFKVVSGLLGMP